MITLKLRDVVSSVEGLQALLSVKLPVKISYRISKIVNGPLERELKAYNEQREKLILQYGVTRPDGSTKVEDPEKLVEFAKKIDELLDLEVQLDWEPINIDDLGEVQLEPKSIISWLFV